MKSEHNIDAQIVSLQKQINSIKAAFAEDNVGAPCCCTDCEFASGRINSLEKMIDRLCKRQIAINWFPDIAAQ